MRERIVLAYSGGLDTSVAIGWIAEETRRRDHRRGRRCRPGRRGPPDASANGLLHAARPSRSSSTLKQEFADEFCLPALQANALYMDRYPLVSALSRPVIVKHLVWAAKEYGASTVAHGCTGKGNDQVRFEVGDRSTCS